MVKNNVAVIGTNPLAEELFKLGREKGIEISLHPSAEQVSASTSLVIETSAGAEEEKKALLQKLDADLSSSAVILSSCLGFAATHIGSWTTRPEKVVGFATFCPIGNKKVIELTAGLKTNEDAIREGENFFRSLGKETERVKDMPGLIFPRILSLIINEAARTLDEGVAEAEEIDLAMRLGTNYPSGPLRWADQVGLDEVLAVLDGLHRETGDDRYRPAPLLKKMVLSGRLGKRTGRGFYQHEEESQVSK